jgi:hypothetical protein
MKSSYIMFNLLMYDVPFPFIPPYNFPLKTNKPSDKVYPRQCPCLGISIHGAYVGAGGFDGFKQKQDARESLPRFGPPEGKDLHLACLIFCCLYSWSCYNGGADEIWPRWKKRRVLAYARGIYVRLEIACLLSRPSSPLYGGRGLGIRSDAPPPCRLGAAHPGRSSRPLVMAAPPVLLFLALLPLPPVQVCE